MGNDQSHLVEASSWVGGYGGGNSASGARDRHDELVHQHPGVQSLRLQLCSTLAALHYQSLPSHQSIPKHDLFTSLLSQGRKGHDSHRASTSKPLEIISTAPSQGHSQMGQWGVLSGLKTSFIINVVHSNHQSPVISGHIRYCVMCPSEIAPPQKKMRPSSPHRGTGLMRA